MPRLRFLTPLDGLFAVAVVLSTIVFLYQVGRLQAVPPYCGPVCKDIDEFKSCSPAQCFKTLFRDCWTCTQPTSLCQRNQDSLCVPSFSFNWRATGMSCTTVCDCGNEALDVESTNTLQLSNYMLWDRIYFCTTDPNAGEILPPRPGDEEVADPPPE